MKNQENFNSQGKRPPLDTNVDVTPVLELSDKDFKAAVIKVLQQVRLNILETSGKIVSAKKQKI